jgi:glycosyltransferase involved in cell wall biosynthesis
VRIPGLETDMRGLYWAADMLVLPSLWEGLPNVALEAAAAGLPALLSHAANLDEIVAPGVTGWEAPTGYPFALAEEMARAFAEPLDTWREMGRLARERIWSRFNPETILAETISMYDQMVGPSMNDRDRQDDLGL